MCRRRAIYFGDSVYLEDVYGPDERADIEAQVEIVERLNADAYQRAPANQVWHGVAFLFSTWGQVPIDREFLRRFPDLQVVFYGAGSVRGFATDEMWEEGIRITHAASLNAVPVAEFTVSQIFFSLKLGWRVLAHVREKKCFPHQSYRFPGAYRTTVGLLSLGLIGRMVAQRLLSSDLNVIAYDPFVSKEEGKTLGVTMVSLEEVFAQAEVVSCHTPSLPSTRKLFTSRHFTMMKANATFLNTARGQVVDEAGLIEVLRRRPDLTAVLDVTFPEPPVPDSPLYILPNVVLTPHIAGSMGSERRRLGRLMADEFRRYLSGEPMLHEINRERVAIMA